MDKLVDLANRYYLGSHDFTITDVPPDKIPSGSGALCEGALLCVNLESPVTITGRRARTAYLKFSHIYLSLLYDIAAKLGARREWTTLTGDGTIAYFTDDGPSNNVWNALLASLYAKTAVNVIIPELSPLFKSLNFSVNSTVHYDTFLAARIGPWGEAALKPIGAPVHIVSEMQGKISGGEILVSKDAVDKLDFATLFGGLKGGNLKYNKILFQPAQSFKFGKEKYSAYKFNENSFEKLLSMSSNPS